jgi:POT family proton-dependent oligopeptide transporter
MAGTLAGHFDIGDSQPFFLIIGFSSIGIGVVLAAASPWIKKLMQGVQ